MENKPCKILTRNVQISEYLLTHGATTVQHIGKDTKYATGIYVFTVSFIYGSKESWRFRHCSQN